MRATLEVGTQGRRSSGVATRALSITTPTGTPALVTVTIPPAWAVAGTAYRLGQGQVAGDREGTSGQVARHERRQPAPHAGRSTAPRPRWSR